MSTPTMRTAGRELDAAVAEALGWMPDPSSDSHFPHMIPPGLSGRSMAVPFFSLGLHAAWTVVEHMRHRGYTVQLDQDPTSDPHSAASARFFREGQRSESEAEEAATVPHAVCLAALAALAREGK